MYQKKTFYTTMGLYVLNSRLHWRSLGRLHDRLDCNTSIDGVSQHSRSTSSGIWKETIPMSFFIRTCWMVILIELTFQWNIKWGGGKSHQIIVNHFQIDDRLLIHHCFFDGQFKWTMTICHVFRNKYKTEIFRPVTMHRFL